MTVIEEIVVLCYDISDDRVRTKVSNLCEKFGGIRVQKSVFEFHSIRLEDLIDLVRRIKKLDKDPGKDDSITIYYIPRSFYKKKEYVVLGENKKKKFRGLGRIERLIEELKEN